MEIDSTRPKPYFNLGLTYARLGDHPSAIATSERAAALNPDDAGIHFALGLSLNAVQRYPEAAEHFQCTIDLQPGRAPFYHQLGEALRATSDFAGAIQAFEAALRLDATHIQARYLLSDLLVRDNRLPGHLPSPGCWTAPSGSISAGVFKASSSARAPTPTNWPSPPSSLCPTTTPPPWKAW